MAGEPKVAPTVGRKPRGKIKRFRIKVGIGIHPDFSEDGNGESKTFRARGTDGFQRGNDIIVTDTDLVRTHGDEKYERLADKADPDEDVAEETDDLNRYTVKQLLKIAEENKIDLEGASRKDDIIARMQVVMEERQTGESTEEGED